MVGYNEGGTVTDCYNEGSITGGNGVGGVVSENSGTVINCYYNVGCCANSNSYGIALTNEQMLRAESFEGFDFETVWTMDGNPGYPYPKLINNFQNCHGVEQLPEIDITKKSIRIGYLHAAAQWCAVIDLGQRCLIELSVFQNNVFQ